MRNDQQSNVWAPSVQDGIAGVWNQVGELLWTKNNLVLPSFCGPGEGLVWGRLTRQQKHIEKYSVLVVDQGPREKYIYIFIYLSDVSYGYKWNTASFGPAIHIGLPLRVSKDLLQKAWKRGGSNLRFPSCPVRRSKFPGSAHMDLQTWQESYQPFPNFPSPLSQFHHVSSSPHHHHQPIHPSLDQTPKNWRQESSKEW